MTTPTHRRWLVPALVALVVLLAATLAVVLFVRQPSSEPIADMSPVPAPTPSGSRGEEWHQFYGREAWAVHVFYVEAVGLLLIVGTDLGYDDVDTAMSVCRAGTQHLARLGVGGMGSVAVYGPERLELASSDFGGPCEPS